MSTATPRKVLVVDDDPVIGRSFDRVLSKRGYAVISVKNGEEALRKIEAEDYDAVFADIRMPGMSGIDVARHLKESRPWLPVVIITGYGTEENEARAKEVGVSGFLRKPLSPEMIGESADAATAARKPEIETAPEQVSAVPAPTEELSLARKILLTTKNIALFFAAPFIGLAYILAFPFVALGAVGMIAFRALRERRVRLHGSGKPDVLGTFLLLLSAPLIGLVFVIAGPFIALGVLIATGIRAARDKGK